MSTDTQLRVLYIVSINAPTSVPLEAAGKIAELSSSHNISFYTATYYNQPDTLLKADFVKDLIELNFDKSYTFKTIKGYYKLIQKINPHIIHLHHGVSAFQGAVLARLAGVKHVFKTEHNDHKFYKWYQKILTVPVFILTSRVICNSKSTMLSYYAWEKWIANSKSTFVYNGIDVNDIAKVTGTEDKQAIRKQLNIKNEDTLFISVGRLIKQKNYKRLVTAMINICKKDKTIKLIIVGGGNQEAQLKELISTNGMEQNIMLTGMVQRHQVYRLVHAADFFIITSLWEGFCNSLVEAMAAGKPILCSDIETLREVAGDVAVAFFKPDSLNLLEEAINKAASLTSDERIAFATAAKKRAYDNFILERTAERYIDEYRSIVQHG